MGRVVVPTYNYRCPQGHELEVFEPITSPTERVCEECPKQTVPCPDGKPGCIVLHQEPVMMKRFIKSTQPPIIKGGTPRFHK